LSDSASFFRLTNEVFTAENKLAARVTSMGGWLDLAARKLTAPPEALAALLRGIPKTPNFEVLPSKP
jgi:acyl-CoA thioester hydrolase